MTEPTIFDFLEARLGEREESAKWLADGGEHQFVLADVASKRKLLELHQESELTESRHGDWYRRGNDEEWIRKEPNECPVCCLPSKDPESPWRYSEDQPCQTIRLLSAPFAAHPDYRPEWAPDASGS